MIPKFAKVTNFSPLHKKNNIRADSGGGRRGQEGGTKSQEEADDRRWRGRREAFLGSTGRGFENEEKAGPLPKEPACI